mgnify:CR=1 FL=1|jgi:predicted nucleotidyltransferase
MNTSANYLKIAEILARHLVREHEGLIHSIVLFGSVARGESTEESDIDLLVVGEFPLSVKQQIQSIRFDYGLEHEVYIQLMFYRTSDLEDQMRMRSWLAIDIANEGFTLHDDGTYERLHREFAGALAAVS